MSPGAGPTAAGDAARAEDAGESSGTGEAAGTGQLQDADSRNAGSGDAGPAAEPGEADDFGNTEAAAQDGPIGRGGAAPELTSPSVADQDAEPQEKPDTPGTEVSDDSAATPMDGEVTVVPGVSRYHRRGCILIRFLSDGDLEITTRASAEAAGSMACKACQPDKPASD